MGLTSNLEPLPMKKGFTLVELLVTICIISMLASLIVATISPVKQMGHRAACLNNARVLNMMNAEGHSIIFGFDRENRYVTKMRNYGDVIIVNCYNCHPSIIDFDRKERL